MNSVVQPLPKERLVVFWGQSDDVVHLITSSTEKVLPVSSGFYALGVAVAVGLPVGRLCRIDTLVALITP